MAEEEHKTREMNDSKHLAAANPLPSWDTPLYLCSAFVPLLRISFTVAKSRSASACIFARSFVLERSGQGRCFWGRAAYFHTTNTFIVSMKSSLACMN
jgi:hypothetical protein